MAEVWRADDTVLGRPVAVKVLDPSVGSDTTIRLATHREARAAAGLTHPQHHPGVRLRRGRPARRRPGALPGDGTGRGHRPRRAAGGRPAAVARRCGDRRPGGGRPGHRARGRRRALRRQARQRDAHPGRGEDPRLRHRRPGRQPPTAACATARSATARQSGWPAPTRLPPATSTASVSCSPRSSSANGPSRHKEWPGSRCCPACRRHSPGPGGLPGRRSGRTPVRHRSRPRAGRDRRLGARRARVGGGADPGPRGRDATGDAGPGGGGGADEPAPPSGRRHRAGPRRGTGPQPDARGGHRRCRRGPGRGGHRRGDRGQPGWRRHAGRVSGAGRRQPATARRRRRGQADHRRRPSRHRPTTRARWPRSRRHSRTRSTKARSTRRPPTAFSRRIDDLERAVTFGDDIADEANDVRSELLRDRNKEHVDELTRRQLIRLLIPFGTESER